MKEQKMVSQIASLLGVPASTLRYWDTEGLVRFERSDENQYRVPTVDTILDICDVMLYRGLSVPIKQIRSIPQMEPEMLRDLLHNTKRRLLEQIRSLQDSVELIDKKQQTLERIEELRCKGFRVIEAQMGEVRAFSVEDGEALRAYVQDCTRSVALMKEDGQMPQYGMIGGTGGEVIRQADACLCQYLYGLLKIDGTFPSNNNGTAFYREAENRGKKCGHLVGRYLLSACENGRKFDYYEGMLSLQT